MTVRPFRLSLILAVLAVAVAAPLAWAQESDLIVMKSGPAQALADTDVTYTVTIFNIGPDASAPITLSDPIPAGMTFVSATVDPAFSCLTPAPTVGGIITCTAPTLAAGVTASFTFVFHIAAGTPDGTTFVNIAIATSASDPNDENNSGIAATSTPFPPSADMGITKTGPASAGPDTDVVYTITVTNGGLDAAADVAVNDTLPGTMTFVALAQSGTPMLCSTPSPGSGGLVSCTAASYPAGGTTTLTLTGHIPPGTPSGTSFTNVATVSATTTDPNPENDQSQTLLVVSSVDISVAKQGPPTVTAGDPVSYAILIGNSVASDTAVNVQLTDPLPPNTTFISLVQDSGPPATCTTPPVNGTGTVNCVFTVLPGGASAEFTLVVQAGDTTSIVNTVTATTDSFDTDSSNNTSSTTTSVDPRANMGVVKNGPLTATAGTNVTYTVTVTNGGPSTASTVSWTETLPANTTFVSLTQTTGPTFTCTTPGPGGTGTITCTLAALPPSTSATFSLVIRLSPSVAAGGTLANTAVVSTTTIDPDPDNNQSTASATTAASADVGVVKSGPDSVAAGSTVTYTILVTNAGPSDAATVSLTDTVPASTTFASLTQNTGPTFTCTTPGPGGTGTVTCNIATLPSGASATFSLVLNVSPVATGSLANTAAVSATTADPNGANTMSTKSSTVVVDADVGVTKSGPATVTAGTSVTYTVTVTNAGPATATSVSLGDTLPPNTTFVSLDQSTGPAFTCLTPGMGGTGTITCTIAAFASGAPATFSLVLNLSPTATGSLTNTANTSAATSDPNTGNNTASTSASVVTADVGVTKTGPASAPAGTNVTYVVTVSNAGPSSATGVSLSDTVPADTTFVSLTQTGGPSFSCASPPAGGTGTITCTIASLPSGASATFSIVVKVSFTATGPLSNTATVTATSPDPVAGNGSATASTTVTPAPADLAITKTVRVDSESPVKAVTYTIVVTNQGPGPASNVVVTDVLPADATLTSATPTQGTCAGTSTVTCTLGTLAPGGSATITLIVSFPVTTRTIANTATVTSTTADPDLANNSATADVPPAAIPTLSSLAFALLALTFALAGFVALRTRRPSSRP